MAHGTRVRWIRAAVAGLGVMVSTSLVGCTSWDKPKDTKSTAQPKIGLPNTTTLPPGGGTAQAGRQPGAPINGAGGAVQQTGFASGGGTRPGTNNLNTTAGGANQQYGAWPPVGSPGTINTPAQPGVSVQPIGWTGGPVGAGAPISPSGGAVANYGQTPPAPDLFPPLPPPSPTGTNEFAGGNVLPPNLGPIAPTAPTSPPPSAGPLYPSKNF